MTTVAYLLPALLAIASPAVAAPPADPCQGAAALTDDAACGDSPLCGQRQRVKLACGLRDAVEQRYIFFSVKGRMLAAQGEAGFDSRRHLDACVSAERALPREDEPLRFYDRMRACASAFEDGHLILGVPAHLPEVTLGLGFRLVEGRVVLATRERSLTGALDGLRVGDELLEIDGQPALAAVDALARHLPGSSLAARRERAVDALGRRDFAYPERRSAALVLSANGARRGLEAPWWTSPAAAGNAMTRRWLARSGVAVSPLAAREAKEREASEEGYRRTAPIVPDRDAAALRELSDAAGRPAVRMGEVARGPDRAFCYLQILTFHTETLGAGPARQGFVPAVEAFVRTCKARRLDLVLDLRHNGGGYIAHSSALLSLLGESTKRYPGGALLLRANTLNQLVYQERSPATGAAPPQPDDAFDPRLIAAAIGAARSAGQEFAPAFLERPLQAGEAVGGYPGRVVALTSPACMSACDRLALMLHASGRALLLGEPTEGAGGSQQESKDLVARWVDPEGRLSLSIPNAAMGVQRALPRPAAARSGADEFFSALAFENRPVEPDVRYGTRLEDVTGQNRGWLRQVDEVLFGGAESGSIPHLSGRVGP